MIIDCIPLTVWLSKGEDIETVGGIISIIGAD
jgi:hypothetical protein